MKTQKLCLGTVQFGMRYGINNELGRQPTKDESFDVLEAAIASGISFFDTASAYGEAERLLGEFGIGNHSVKVISKLPPGTKEDVFVVVSAIKESLGRLGVDSLYGYMLHSAEDFYKPEMIEGLLRAKEARLVEAIGVSVYKPTDAVNVVYDGRMDIVQVPYNLLDQRLDATGFFELAEKNHVRIFARSAFLQGLLLMEPERIPPNLAEARPYVKRFRDIAAKHGYSPLEAAFLYSVNHSHIDCTVFGVDTRGQLQDNLDILNKVDGFEACGRELHGAFGDVPQRIISPDLWYSTEE